MRVCLVVDFVPYTAAISLIDSVNVHKNVKAHAWSVYVNNFMLG